MPANENAGYSLPLDSKDCIISYVRFLTGLLPMARVSSANMPCNCSFVVW